MVILESVLLLILLRFFGLGSSENAPKTPAEAARQAQGMRKAADYIKEHGDEKDPEKIKKEVNKEIEESPIPEEEKKDMENGVSNVLNQETVPAPENIEKQAENMEKVSKTFEGLDHDKDGNIINNTKLEEKLVLKLTKLNEELYLAADNIDSLGATLATIDDYKVAAEFCRDSLIPAMNGARVLADEIEATVDKEMWPYPTYGDILFAIH